MPRVNHQRTLERLNLSDVHVAALHHILTAPRFASRKGIESGLLHIFIRSNLRVKERYERLHAAELRRVVSDPSLMGKIAQHAESARADEHLFSGMLGEPEAVEEKIKINRQLSSMGFPKFTREQIEFGAYSLAMERTVTYLLKPLVEADHLHHKKELLFPSESAKFPKISLYSVPPEKRKALLRFVRKRGFVGS